MLFWLGPLVLLLPNTFKLFGFPIFRFCAYLMKIIPETRLRLYYYHWVDISAGGLVIPDGVIHPGVNVSALVWFNSLSIIEIYSF
jgi:hypothetical protein